MNLSDILKFRLINQQISQSDFKTPGEIVGWMGTMQAQDFKMSKWAIGIRLPNSTEQETEAAFNGGKIIRIHLLRPTWHLVSSEDVHWMLELSAPRIRASMKARDMQLELTDAVFKKSNNLLERVLAGGNHLTREELIVELQHAGIDTGENRASHLFMRAETDGIICSGRIKSGKTILYLAPRMGSKDRFVDQGRWRIARLAERYFTSHGPATLQDFVWWSGLLRRRLQNGA